MNAYVFTGTFETTASLLTCMVGVYLFVIQTKQPVHSKVLSTEYLYLSLTVYLCSFGVPVNSPPCVNETVKFTHFIQTELL